MYQRNLNNLRYVFYGLFVLAFLFVAYSLLVTSKSDFFYQPPSVDRKVGGNVSIIFPDSPSSLDPVVFDPTTRQRLVNIYEPLVKTDKDFKIEGALALSWGLIDNNTWEFHLRPNVVFHDKSKLDVDDVFVSLNRAVSHPSSGLKELLSTINDITKINDLSFRIVTDGPDPLLLQRLSTVLIFPSEYDGAEDFQPVGTGPYKFSSWEAGNKLSLEFFDSYWGKSPSFKKVYLLERSDKSKRVNDFLAGDADVLSFVPYEAVDTLVTKGFIINMVPNLEVQFLAFNMKSAILADLEVRKALSLALNKQALVDSLGGFAKPVSQYVSNGIFGFNPNIADVGYDVDVAKKIIVDNGLTGVTLQFHLLAGQTVMGDFLRTSLADLGVNVVVSYLDGSTFMDSVTKGKADMYFFGFKSDLGDASDFLNTILYSSGSFNVGNYKNSKMDFLIEESGTQMDSFRRRGDLQSAMKMAVDDFVGVPLFEFETVFASNDKVNFEPRLDGLIYVNEITAK